MNLATYDPFEDLIDLLRMDGSVRYEVDRPSDLENGQWWLDLVFNDKSLVVAWKREVGFMLWEGSEGYGQKPNETYANVILLHNRLTELLGIEE